MVDLPVKRLIERVVDSPLKLQLLLLFCEHRRLQGTDAQIAQRIYRDIGSTHEALCELAEDGILAVVPMAGEPTYVYRPRPEWLDPIVRLCQVYNEPIERDSLQRLVRDVAVFAPYRRTKKSFEPDRFVMVV